MLFTGCTARASSDQYVSASLNNVTLPSNFKLRHKDATPHRTALGYQTGTSLRLNCQARCIIITISVERHYQKEPRRFSKKGSAMESDCYAFRFGYNLSISPIPEVSDAFQCPQWPGMPVLPVVKRQKDTSSDFHCAIALSSPHLSLVSVSQSCLIPDP